MKLFTSKRYQRFTNLSLAALLFVSTITASVPFLFAEKAAALPVSNTAVYTGLPAVQPATYPSIGFAATSTKELGDRVTLAGTNRHLDDVTFSLTSWACETGEWNLNNCVSTPGATFSHPVTVNLYAVNADGTVGAVVATKTQTINAQYRPSADNTNCTGANVGKWFNAANATCYNGKAFDVNFDFSAQNAILPNEVVATVAYDGNASAAAKALNVSLITSTAPTVGTDTDPSTMYEDSTYPGSTAGLKAADYSPYRLAMNISASTIAGPTGLKTVDSYGKDVTNGATNATTGTNSWNAVPGAVSYDYEYTKPAGLPTFTYTTTGTSLSGEWNAGNNVEGTYVFRVRATFPGGATSEWSAPSAATYDATGPATPTAQSPNGWNQTANQFNWTSSSDAGSAVHYTLQYSRTHENNIADTTIENITTNSYAQTLDNGPLFWRVQAIDAAGNLSAWSATQYATIDHAGPAIEFVAPTPAEGQAVKGTISVKVRATDNEALKRVAVNLYRNGTFLVACGSTSGATPLLTKETVFSCNIVTTGYTDGEYELRASATDLLGNGTATAKRFLSFDKTDSTAVATLSDVAISKADTSPVLTAELSDTTSNITNLKYRVFKVNADDSTTAVTDVIDGLLPVDGIYNAKTETVVTTINTSTLDDGNYRVILYIYDAAGNQGKKTVSFFVDKTVVAPVATTPTGDLNASQVPAGFSWTQAGTEAHGPLTYKVITAATRHGSEEDGILKNGAQYVNAEGITGTFLPYTFTDGTFYWQVEATDTLGNKSYSNSHAVTIDTVVSAPTLVSPDDNAVVNGATLTQKWANSDSDINRYVYESYNSATTTESNLRFRGEYTTKEKTATNISDGTFYWRVKAIDNLGNQSGWSELWKLTVDSTKPGVSIDPIAVNPTTISGTVTEAATVKITVDGTEYIQTTTAAGAWSIPNPATAQGTHTVSVVATDLAGNTTTPAATATFLIDTVAPVTSLVADETTVGNDATVTLTASIGDATSYALTLDGVVIAGFDGTTHEFDTTGLASGEYEFVLNAKDGANNAATPKTVTITVDNDGPAVAVDAGTYTTAQPVITGTVDADTETVAIAIVNEGGAVVENGTATYVPGDTTFSYAVQTALANGNYTIFARAYDAFGNFTDSAASIAAVAVPAPATPIVVTPLVTPLITPASAAAVLGANTDDTASAEVKGATTDVAATDKSGVNNNDGTIFGIAWFWWLLIIAALAAAAWWIIGAIRRRNGSEA